MVNTSDANIAYKLLPRQAGNKGLNNNLSGLFITMLGTDTAHRNQSSVVLPGTTPCGARKLLAMTRFHL